MLFNFDTLEAIEELVAMEESVELSEANPSLFELLCLFPIATKSSSANIEEVFLFDSETEYLSDEDIIL